MLFGHKHTQYILHLEQSSIFLKTSYNKQNYIFIFYVAILCLTLYVNNTININHWQNSGLLPNIERGKHSLNKLEISKLQNKFVDDY